MSEAENQPEATTDGVIEDLQDDVQSLRTLMSVTLIVLVVFTLCMNWFLFKQISVMTTQREAAQKGALEIKAYADDLWNRLSDYGRTHADINYLLDKYRPTFVTNTPPASAAPAPRK